MVRTGVKSRKVLLNMPEQFLVEIDKYAEVRCYSSRADAMRQLLRESLFAFFQNAYSQVGASSGSGSQEVVSAT